MDSATLTLSRSILDAGTQQSSVATLTAYTGSGAGARPQNNVQAVFSSTGDVVMSIHSCSTNTSGQCKVTLTPGLNFGPQTISVKVSGLAYSSQASAQLWQYDAASAVTVTALPLQADGLSTSNATATVTDPAGRGISGESVSISVNGQPLTVVDNGNGTYSVPIGARDPSSAYASGFTEPLAASVSGTNPSLPTASGSLSVVNPPPKLAGPLHATSPTSTTPARIVDANNNPVVLQGVNVLLTNYPYGINASNFLTPPMVGNLYLWGANFVRLQISSDLLLHSVDGVNCPNETYPPTSYASDLQNQVNLITTYGMYVLLDFHASNPGCLYSSNGSSGGARPPLPSVSDSQALWNYLGQTYGGNPLVGFELYNEPHVCATGPGTASSSPCTHIDQPADDQAWVNGGSLNVTNSNGTSSYQGAGMAQLYNDVRNAAGSSNLVFIDSNDYASNRDNFADMANLGMSSLSNVVYVYHYYGCEQTVVVAQCYNAKPETCAQISSDLGSIQKNPLTGAFWPAPTMIDEFGWPQNIGYYQYAGMRLNVADNGSFVNNVLTELQSEQVGWAIYTYGAFGNPPWQGPYTILSGTTVAPGSTFWQPNKDGKPAVEALQGQQLSCISVAA
ncbi:MAG: cellulase family glycosylhydrolase [Acidimicrobiales bacterium]